MKRLLKKTWRIFLLQKQKNFVNLHASDLSYEELKFKSDLAKLNAMKAESNWAYLFWSKIAEQLEVKALQCEVN